MAGEIPRDQPPPAQPGPDPARHPHLLLWRWRRNPLRRASDRFQARLSLGLVLAVLVAAPAALVAAWDRAERHYRGAAEQQVLTRERQSAVLVRDAPRHPEPGSDEAERARYSVPVRLSDPQGGAQTGRADVEPGLPAGTPVTVWVDGQGRLTDPPLTEQQIRSHTMGWALLAFLGVVLTGCAAHAVTTRILHRHNLARWDAEWAETAARWSRLP